MLFKIGDAWFSKCRKYRYTLDRQWNYPAKRRDVWLMLNPSTADEYANDPTVARCVNFSRSWGSDGLFVANIFALRSTDPKGLLEVEDPVGPENDEAIAGLVKGADRVICAWGNHGDKFDRAESVVELLREKHWPVYCLGINKGGQPKHPLYVKSTKALEVYLP